LTFKAYLENIQAKTGKSPEQFFELAEGKGLIKGGKIVAKYSDMLTWLKSDMGLGHGHANAMILYFRIETNDPSLEKTKDDVQTKKKTPKSRPKS
jgi:hypothetical protein